MMDIERMFVMSDGRVSRDEDDKAEAAIIVEAKGFCWTNKWFRGSITQEQREYLVKQAEIAMKRINK